VLGGDVTGMQGKNGEAFLIDTLKCFVGKAGPHSLALPFVSSPQDCVQLTGTLVGAMCPRRPLPDDCWGHAVKNGDALHDRDTLSPSIAVASNAESLQWT